MQEAKHVISQLRFPQKLWYLLELHTNVIFWGGTGRTILLNYKVLKNYLQNDRSIFKTTNISSFIRQLNLYGFRKVTSHLQDPLCNSSNPYMHEFIHDNFQYGRPELMDKITRKALTVKKSSKQMAYSGHLVYMSPLQKARRALRIALQKAALDLRTVNSSKSDCKSDCDDVPEDYYVNEENVEQQWLITKTTDNDTSQYELPQPDPIDNVKVESQNEEVYGNKSGESLVDFSDDASQQNKFAPQFLSMPDLDGASEDTSGVELLAEFNIGNEPDQGIIIRKSSEHESPKQPECNSLNCVLPSVSNEYIDVSMLEKNNEDINNYNSEWDQMFNDMLSNKNSNQEGDTNLRELYSQISQTIDLLNS